MSTRLPDSTLAIAVDIGGTFTDIALHDASSGRMRRANCHAWGKPARPVPASRVFEVKERIGAGGVVIEPLDEASVEAAANQCRKFDVEAVAVCLLHSFANPAHERTFADILRAKLPGVAVTA